MPNPWQTYLRSSFSQRVLSLGLHIAEEPPYRPWRKSAATQFLILWVCSILCFPSWGAAAENPIKSLSPFIANGGYALQMDGQVIYSSNLEKSFIPASTMKVLTALMALEILGPDYRFATRFYLSPDKLLYIKGEGDPFLTSEVITQIATLLKEKGIDAIKSIVLDDSAFALENPPPGSTNTINPYDAYPSSLAVNFNSLPFIVTKDGKILSGEKQTPLLPMMNDFARGYRKGSFRVNVSAFSKREGYSNILRYCGELFSTLFHQEGISINEGYRIGKTAADARPVLVYESEKRLSELVRLCLRYSSNFIADQLYLSCGRRVYGFPATWQKAGKMAKKFIELRLPSARNKIQMFDGSGLSRENRISPIAMLTVLNRFLPYASLLKRKKDVLVKSGTLNGVYSYVGYFQTEKSLSPFVLFLNQQRNNRKTLIRLMENEFRNILKKNGSHENSSPHQSTS